VMARLDALPAELDWARFWSRFPRIGNTFTTGPFFSRLHLMTIEPAALAFAEGPTHRLPLLRACRDASTAWLSQ